MEKIKSILKSASFDFKKKFGQNFITDDELLQNIVALSGVCKDDVVIEIGCGAGTLTRVLARAAKRVLGFEVDLSLRPVLEETLFGLDNVEMVFADFLKTDIADLERNLNGYVIVANLPYYITSPIIMKILDECKKCKSLTVMVQDEVANRLCASAGSSDYGAITAMIAPRADCKKVLNVPRSFFTPQPNVDSAVVKIDFCKKIEIEDMSKYRKVVQTAFSSRRKTLANNIMHCYNLPRAKVEQILFECGIDLTVRGEVLDYKSFNALSHRL